MEATCQSPNCMYRGNLPSKKYPFIVRVVVFHRRFQKAFDNIVEKDKVHMTGMGRKVVADTLSVGGAHLVTMDQQHHTHLQPCSVLKGAFLMLEPIRSSQVSHTVYASPLRMCQDPIIQVPLLLLLLVEGDARNESVT
jgi:hypothetical protein